MKHDEKGFGFIETESGGILFFHLSGCIGGSEGFFSLGKGDIVRVETVQGKGGKVQGVAVEKFDGEFSSDRSTEQPPIYAGSIPTFAKAEEARLNRISRKERLKFLLDRVHSDAHSPLKASKRLRQKFFGQEFNAFVLSVDIRRSTELMLKTRRTTEGFATFLSTLCEDLEYIVKRNYGVFDKFTGDGILAFFPQFFSGRDAAFFAVKAANECHVAFEKQYHEFRNIFSSVLIDVGLGIGIDFGVARLARMSNSYTIIGTPVVYACRMSAAPAGQTYANQCAYEIISEKFAGSIGIAETIVQVKHEGPLLAYSITLTDQDFTPEFPGWFQA